MSTSKRRWLRLPRVPFGTAWAWVRARAAAGWSEHRGVAAHVARHVAVLGAFALVVLLIHRELYSFLSRQDRYAIDPGADEVAVQPEWADRTGAEPHPGSVAVASGTAFDKDLVERIARAFARNPWVRRVTSVERVFPNRVRIRYELREPHLAVRTNRGHVLLDADLVRLPGLYGEVPVEIPRPVVLGMKGNPPEAGGKWDSLALRAGREVAELAADHPTLAALDIRAVDVSDPSGNVILVAGNGCAVHWGRPECLGDRGELPAARKLDHLRRVLAHYPRLDGLESVLVYVEPTVRLRDAGNARGSRRR